MATGSNLDLLQRVDAILLPRVAATGLAVTSHAESTSFDDADVKLRSGNLVVRVLRERSIVHLELASSQTPFKFFDSAVVMDYLGITKDGGFHDQDVDSVLVGIANFLTAFWRELGARFAPEAAAQTNEKLVALRKERDAQRWGAPQGEGAA